MGHIAEGAFDRGGAIDRGAFGRTPMRYAYRLTQDFRLCCLFARATHADRQTSRPFQLVRLPVGVSATI